MPAHPRTPAVFRLAVAPAVLFVAAVALAADPPEPAKKPADPPKTVAPPVKDKDPAKPPPVGVRLPDGTFLWTGPGTAGADGNRVLLTPQEYQQLLDQVDQLKKQLAARKAAAPAECALRGRVEKRGETLVAALKLTYTIRTPGPNTAVALGGRGGLLVSATLDKNKLPILDKGEEGLVALIETAGDHSLALELDAPVTGRGAKAEVGFELGLPRAAITTLALDPPPGVSRVGLSTRAADPAEPGKPPELRRVPALDVKQLAPRPNPYPLGTVDAVEITWDPPAAAPAADAAQTAEWEVNTLLAEGFVETTARVRPRGPTRTWRIAAPADAAVTADRANPATPAADAGPVASPVVSKPTDNARPVWKVELPAGTTAADWAVTAVVRTPRAKAADAKHKGPFPVGPFAALDVTRQTGTVRITAPPHTRLTFKHGPDVRQEAPPAPPADETVAVFRFATGPTGASPPPAPLLEFEARALSGLVEVRPHYKLHLTEGGWQVRAELQVSPIRREIDTVLIDLPAEWKSPVVSPPEVVDGVQPMKADGPRQVLAVRLAAGQKQPFDLLLTATVPVPAGTQTAAILLPRFPGAGERDAAVTAAVQDGFEVRGAGRKWDGDQPAAWGQSLGPASDPDGKPPKGATAIAGKFDHGLARVDLAWSPHRPELAADVRADVTVQDGQAVVVEQIKLHGPEGLARVVRFRGPPGLTGLKATPPLDSAGSGEWAAAVPADARDATFSVVYAVPLPPRTAGGGRKVPVGLLWPAGATRADSLVRVWNGSADQTLSAAAGAWREMPPEPVPGRDTLPALTLAGSGAELPLVLDVRAATEAAAAVWVERGLVQAWVGDDGTATYRARFLIGRWIADSVELRLPSALVGTPEVLIDERKTDPHATDESGSLRVRLPEPRPGRTTRIEVRYRLPANRGAEDAPGVLAWPRAAVSGPVRWQVSVPEGSVPLVVGGWAEQRWALRTALLVPAATSTDSLERWYQTGADPGDGGGASESAVLRLTGAEAVRVYHVPRGGLVIIGSVVVLLVGLVVSRLPGGLAGPVVALLAGAGAVAAVMAPQPTGQVAAAAEPGLAGLVLILVTQAAVRRYYDRRVSHLPGFARGRPEPATGTGSAIGTASGRPRSSGSTGPFDPGIPVAPHPVAPSSG